MFGLLLGELLSKSTKHLMSDPLSALLNADGLRRPRAGCPPVSTDRPSWRTLSNQPTTRSRSAESAVMLADLPPGSSLLRGGIDDRAAAAVADHLPSIDPATHGVRMGPGEC
jgi:hypothetical protein